MTEVIGKCEVSLSKPIDMSPDFSASDVPVCQFQIDESRITIEPLIITELVQYGDGDYESPKLTEIKVSIVKEVILFLLEDK